MTLLVFTPLCVNLKGMTVLTQEDESNVWCKHILVKMKWSKTEKVEEQCLT